jgi:hypothetical protein
LFAEVSAMLEERVALANLVIVKKTLLVQSPA